MSPANMPAPDAISRKGIYLEFYDPDGTRYGLPTYPYRWAPDGLLTRRQLRARGLRPAGQRIAAQILWKHKGRRRVAYLYRADLAKPKRTATKAQLLAIQAALRARRTCPTCGSEQDYYIRFGEPIGQVKGYYRADFADRDGYPPLRCHRRRCGMTTGEAPPAVHTLDEAAAILRVKPSWLERQAAARRIPFTMLGGSYRFTAEHLAAIVRQYEQRPVIASADEPSRAAARQATATQLPTDIKVKPLRPRPRRAA